MARQTSKSPKNYFQANKAQESTNLERSLSRTGPQLHPGEIYMNAAANWRFPRRIRRDLKDRTATSQLRLAITAPSQSSQTVNGTPYKNSWSQTTTIR